MPQTQKVKGKKSKAFKKYQRVITKYLIDQSKTQNGMENFLSKKTISRKMVNFKKRNDRPVLKKKGIFNSTFFISLK